MYNVQFQVVSDINMSFTGYATKLGHKPYPAEQIHMRTKKCTATYAWWPRDHIDVIANLKSYRL